MFYTNKFSLDTIKKLPYKEQMFYFTLVTWSFVGILLIPLSLYFHDIHSVSAEIASFVISLSLYFGYRKTRNLDLFALLLLWSIAILLFILNTFNQYDLDIVLTLFIPLLGSLTLKRRVLIQHGLLFSFLQLSFIVYGYIQHPEYVLFTNSAYLTSYLTLYIFTVTFAMAYHIFIESAYTLLERSNQSKEVLLQEIHHRVKNNLNMMSSILALQCNQQSDKTVKILQTNRNRIDSIAMVHESLYETKDFRDINFKSYIEKLINHLAFISSKKNIKLDIQSNGIIFSLDIMTNLALLLQELITNSIKYALKSETPFISIILQKNSDTNYSLSYADDGNKLINEYSPSLGMRIVELKVKEMSGTFVLSTNNGFVYNINFNIS